MLTFGQAVGVMVVWSVCMVGLVVFSVVVVLALYRDDSEERWPRSLGDIQRKSVDRGETEPEPAAGEPPRPGPPVYRE